MTRKYKKGKRTIHRGVRGEQTKRRRYIKKGLRRDTMMEKYKYGMRTTRRGVRGGQTRRRKYVKKCLR